MLSETPLCQPAFITLSGLAPGEGCVIERTETAARVREAPAAVANHWVDLSPPCHDRGWDSPGRLRMMEGLRERALDDFAWVTPPIFNPTTRLAVIANARLGTLLVQGWEADGPATTVFALSDADPIPR